MPAYYRQRIEIDGDHWFWIGSVNYAGYGLAHNVKPALLAHRAVWSVSGGELAVSDHLHHLCRVKRCVRPDHLTVMDASSHKKLHASEKTHCPYGHEMNEANTYWRKDGDGRQCMACNRDRQNRYRRAKPKSERRKLDIARNERRRRAKGLA